MTHRSEARESVEALVREAGRIESLSALVRIKDLRAVLYQPTREEVVKAIRDGYDAIAADYDGPANPQGCWHSAADAVLALFNRTPPHD